MESRGPYPHRPVFASVVCAGFSDVFYTKSRGTRGGEGASTPSVATTSRACGVFIPYYLLEERKTTHLRRRPLDGVSAQKHAN